MKVWLFGSIPLPILFFTWPPMKLFYPFFGIKIELIDEFKEETDWRLKEVCDCYRSGEIDTAFLAGGHSDHHPHDSATMSREWLIRHGIPESDIFSENDSVDTGSNIRSLVNFVNGEDPSVRITIITSWYHMRHAVSAARKSLPRIEINEARVYPRIIWKCLRREYLHNILSEPLKRIMTVFPGLLALLEHSERKTRKGYVRK